MKYKKYVLVLLLLIFTGWNTVAADNDWTTILQKKYCYYMGDGFNSKVRLGYTVNGQATAYSNTTYFNLTADVSVELVNGKIMKDAEALLNFYADSKTIAGKKFEALHVSKLYDSSNIEEISVDEFCPTFLVFQHGGFWNDFKVWGTNDEEFAKEAVNGIISKNAVGLYASRFDSDGNEISAEKYYFSIVPPNAGGQPICDSEETDPKSPEYCGGEKVCSLLFGKVTDVGEKDVDVNGNGKIDPPSLAYLVDGALKYVRIIVPILVILLGMFDLGKAVLAGKEDEMRKAQITFVKRIAAGVLVFFVPSIVNLIMQLADVIWNGVGLSNCRLP